MRATLQYAFELSLALRCDEKLIGHELETTAAGELLGARAIEHHVRRVLHHFASQVDRVTDALHAGYGASFQIVPRHDRRIEFGMSFMGQHGATACIEKWVVFKNANRRGDGIEAAATLLEHGIAGIQRFGEARAVTRAIIGAELLACDHPSAAVDGDRERSLDFGISRAHCNDRGQ